MDGLQAEEALGPISIPRGYRGVVFMCDKLNYVRYDHSSVDIL